jgi:hypothetical protein
MIVQVHVETETDIIDKDFELDEDADVVDMERLTEELAAWLREAWQELRRNDHVVAS